jgi:hypothetical protein
MSSHAVSYFTSPEERLFAGYLTDTEYSVPPDQIDWIKLFLFYPSTCLYSKVHRLGLPPQVEGTLKQLAVQCMLRNQKRLNLMRRIAAIATEARIPVLFVKGAAEIADHADDDIYMYSRTMGDIDMICEGEHIERLHGLLVEGGHIFHDYGLADAFDGDMAMLRHYLLTKTGHLSYNFDSDTDKIELHRNVSNDADLSSYPPRFFDLLRDEARTVALGPHRAFIPSPEHMVAYCLCHAASPKNNIFFPETPLPGSPQPMRDSIPFNLGCFQLRLLSQLQRLLESYPGLDMEKIRSLLVTVQNPLLQDYIALASYYLEGFTLQESVTPQMLIAARRRNIRIHFLQQYARYKVVGLLRKYFHGKARTSVNRVLLRIGGRFV